jgi:hypothetical protein
VAKAMKRTGKTIRLWTAQDIKQLKQMNRRKAPTKTIAKTLHRTLAALYMKASQQGISLKK